MKTILSAKSPFSAFTLIELMAASTVLSMMLLLMVGMQDQMSRAWANANRRTDATREARTALRLMMGDLSKMVLRPASYPADNFNPVVNASVAMVVGGQTNSLNRNPLQISSWLPDSSYCFGVVPRRPTANNSSDLALVGYYVASTTTTNVSGFTNPAYNLYRYYVPQAADLTTQLQRWMINNPLLQLPATPGDTNNEVVARNVVGLNISFFGLTNQVTSGGTIYYPVTNGLNRAITEGRSGHPCTGNRIRIQLVTYPDEIAARFNNLSAWTATSNLARFSRVYELGLDVRRSD
jgi:type II secretory pathway pseudopilin PulG